MNVNALEEKWSMKNKKPSSKTKKPKTSLLVQLAQQKAEAQKAGKNSKNFDKFKSSKFGQGKPLLGPSWGGRNGQGKP